MMYIMMDVWMNAQMYELVALHPATQNLKLQLDPKSFRHGCSFDVKKKLELQCLGFVVKSTLESPMSSCVVRGGRLLLYSAADHSSI